MKLNVGDTVKFLNETGGGKILRLDNQGYVYVMTDDGFEIPVRASELIMVSPARGIPETRLHDEEGIARSDKTRYKPPSNAGITENLAIQLPENIPSGTHLKLLLGLVPDDADAVFKASVNCYLINDSDYFLYYMIGYQQQGRYFLMKSGEIEPNTKCFLSGFNQNRLGKIALFHIQALPVSSGQYFKMTPMDQEIEVAHYDFMKNHMYKANDYFDEKALILDITDPDSRQQKESQHFPADEQTGKNAAFLQTKKSGTQVTDGLEIDLHIEALREDYSQLSNTEILRIQMNRFRSALEDAISNKARRIVFIHGVGNGTLKLELRNELKRSYPEFTYQDASFKEYGFGATMVHFR